MHRNRYWVVCIIGTLWSPGLVSAQSVLASTRQQNPQSSSVSKDPRKLPLRLYRDYLVIVKGSVSQTLEEDFLVDTGAYPSVVDIRVAASLGLEERPARVNLSKQTMRTQVAVLPSLDIGPLHATSLPVLTQDLTFLSNAIGHRIGGIVGLDVLRKRSFRIDYVKKEIEFALAPNLASCAPFETDTPIVSVRMTSGSHRFRVVIDTGGPDLMFFETSVRESANFKELGSEQVSDSSGSFRRKRILVPDVYLGKERIGPQVDYMVDRQTDAGDDFDAVLGVRGAHFRKIAFDFENRQFCWQQ